MNPVEIKKVHIGKVIRKKMHELRIKPKELIEAMRFKSKNSLYYYFKQASMDIGMLSLFSEKMGYNFFIEYLNEEDKTQLASGVEVNMKEFKSISDQLAKCKRELNREKLESSRLKDTIIKSLLKDDGYKKRRRDKTEERGRVEITSGQDKEN